MRYKTEFDYALKIRQGQGLQKNPETGKVYDFEKTIDRIYPLNLPILLIDDDYNVYGKCIILQATYGNNKTCGKYKIIKLYNNEMKKIFTKDYIETLKIMKEINN